MESHPGFALLVGVLVLAAGAVMVWPGHGVLARLATMRRRSSHVLGEDLLKQLYKDTVSGTTQTLEGLSARLSVGAVPLGAVIEELREAGLVEFRGASIVATQRGRDVGKHLVRAHRLWELYLSRETGYDPREWHARAETMEHHLGRERVRAMEARLGNPVHDPDGDPIPRRAPRGTGAIPEKPPGQPLPEVPMSGTYRVTHLEDEPDDVYGALLDLGLYYGMRFSVAEVSGSAYVLDRDGTSIAVPTVLAANITVEPCDGNEGTTSRLSTTKVGEVVEVVEVTEQARGAERQRFLDLGFVPGARVVPQFHGPGGSPTAFRVKDSLIALRPEQAEKIRVRPVVSELEHHGDGRRSVSAGGGEG